MELILKESIRIDHKDDNNSAGIIVSVDTTVQEKNITYPRGSTFNIYFAKQ